MTTEQRCLGRLTKWSSRLPFGDGRHYFTLEQRCKRGLEGGVEGSVLCSICETRPLEGKYQDSLLHGTIVDPIPEQSVIYGGLRYLEGVKRYGEPAAEAVEAALEAHKVASEGYSGIQMVREGATKREKKRSVGAGADSNPCACSAVASSSSVKPIAIEGSERPIHVDVEQVVVKKCVVDGKSFYIDEKGRRWACNEKGVITGRMA